MTRLRFLASVAGMTADGRALTLVLAEMMALIAFHGGTAGARA